MKKKTYIIRSYILITYLLFHTIMVYGQTTAQISLSFMIYDNAGGQKTLYFGLDQTATNGIDVHLGESILPPLPPNGAFDARWLLPNNNFNGSLSSLRDYRFASGFPFSGTIEHRFGYQSATGATAMFFSWNLPPTITALIQDLANGAIINIPISGNGIYQISNFESIDRLKLFIYYNNVVSVEENNPQILSEFNLEQNYPNPFNPSTQIKFSVSKQTQLKINMYNTLGELVQTIAEGVYEPGYYEVTLNAENLVSGVYIYRMESPEIVQSKKLILIR